ncbi:MAG: FkbM family methyltransferase [Acidobacteriia bacterium]|nr:FkbM family methyltransferase [Terriglobia bacterium]
MIPQWLKSNRLYPLARVAALSLFGPDRFYSPLSAVALYDGKYEEDREEIRREIQIVRQEGGVTIWRTRLGQLATMDTENVGHVGFLVNEFQTKAYCHGTVDVRPGAVVLDIGANVGLFAKQAVRAGAQRVVCMEPTPGTLLALRWNLASEIAAGTVVVVPKGAWDSTGTLRFTVDPKRPGRSSFVNIPPEEAAYEVVVDVEPVDAVVQDLRLSRVDFIKMDIEGAELKALDGAAETLRRYQPQLAIAVEHTTDPRKNAKMVRELVLRMNSEYRCKAGRYTITRENRLAPEILYFA